MTPKANQAYRAQGLGKEISVPDVNAPGFLEELRRQVATLNEADEAEAMSFIEAVADWNELE